MTLKLVHTAPESSNGSIVKVYRDTAWNQYIVKPFHKGGNGKHINIPCTNYYTQDKSDALSTAAMFDRRAN